MKKRVVTGELLVFAAMMSAFFSGALVSGALVAWFISFGLFVSLLIIERARRILLDLSSTLKLRARVYKNGKWSLVAIEEVQKDDLIAVFPGEVIPVVGFVIEGETWIDESNITGEPFPICVIAGSQVTSGSLNLSSPIKVKSSVNGENCFIVRLIKESFEALKRRGRIQTSAMKFSQVFILGVILTGLVVFALTGDISRTTTIYAITCPCAWVLATPIAFAIVISLLARSGIIVKSGEAIERLASSNVFVLDKTGTLTSKSYIVKNVICLKLPKDGIVELVVALESKVSHPISQVILSAFSSIKPSCKVESIKYIPGFGVKGIVNGKKVIICSTLALMKLGLVKPKVRIYGSPCGSS